MAARWPQRCPPPTDAPRQHRARHPARPSQPGPRNSRSREIKTLIRDPFAIYARKVLRLNALGSAGAQPPMRRCAGRIDAKILERVHQRRPRPRTTARRSDADRAKRYSPNTAHGPRSARNGWRGWRASADQFLADEVARQALAADTHCSKNSAKSSWPASGVDTDLQSRPDRPDRSDEALIYDYKTGAVPTGPAAGKIRQAIVARGGDGRTWRVQRCWVQNQSLAATFIGVNATMKNSPSPAGRTPARTGLGRIRRRSSPHWHELDRGYTARIALFSKSDISDYDQLSRFGEWDTTRYPDPGGADMIRDEATQRQVDAADPGDLDMAVGECRVRQNPRADRPRCAAVAGKGVAAEHPVPDLYQGRRRRDAEPPVPAAWANGR